jgi:outer membrane protein assembly factor BamB
MESGSVEAGAVFVGFFVDIDAPAGEVRSRLRVGREWLVRLARSATADGEGLLSRAGRSEGLLSEVVRVRIGACSTGPRGAVLPIRWDAAARSGVSSVIDGNLVVAALPDRRCRLVVEASYRPALTQFGPRLDSVSLERLAEATLRSFLARVATELVSQHWPAAAEERAPKSATPVPDHHGGGSPGAHDGAEPLGSRRGWPSRRSRLARGSLVLAAVAVVAFGLSSIGGSSRARAVRTPSGVMPPRQGLASVGATSSGAALPFASPPGEGTTPGPNLAPGSDPAVLPGDVLIADEDNNRLLVVNPAGNIVWQFPQSGNLPAGTTFLRPDDAFFSENGKQILATEETDQVLSLIDLGQARILWRYGTPGVPGSGPDQVDNPDDAMLLPNGDVLVADIKNCNLLLVGPGAHTPMQRIGIQSNSCLHQPPRRFGSPNGAFPLTDGNYLVTEINGDWVDEMTLAGKVLWSTHPPGVAYPSDTNEVSPGVYLTVDYSTPGQIVEFNQQGQLLWRYGPTSGPGMLNQPSLCEPIPTNGDILCNDDANDRVIVVDPRTNRIVWQYGHAGVEGTAPGYLSGPDGVDLAPPYSMLVRHGPNMGLPQGCLSSLPAGACTTFP